MADIDNLVEAFLTDDRLGKTISVFLDKILLLQTSGSCQDDSVCMRTVKYRMLCKVAESIGLSFEDIGQLMATHIPVDPDVAHDLKRLCSKYECVNTILAQDFVESDKLIKLIKFMYKNGLVNEANALMALDGLGGPKLNNGPCLDVKRYVDNLRFGKYQGKYDKYNIKRLHVCAVRKVYEELAKHKVEDAKLLGAYQVMCQVLKDVGIELPVAETLTPLSPDVLKACVDMYKFNMTEDNFTALAESLKNKIVQSEDEEAPSPKRKRVERNEPAETSQTECGDKSGKK